jgi:hypothetical protein
MFKDEDVWTIVNVIHCVVSMLVCLCDLSELVGLLLYSIFSNQLYHILFYFTLNLTIFMLGFLLPNLI